MHMATYTYTYGPKQNWQKKNATKKSNTKNTKKLYIFKYLKMVAINLVDSWIKKFIFNLQDLMCRLNVRCLIQVKCRGPLFLYFSSLFGWMFLKI
jgi:hypothetical protein